MSNLAEAIKSTSQWREGFRAGKAGAPIEANPYKWAIGPGAQGDRAKWEAGWQAARSGCR